MPAISDQRRRQRQDVLTRAWHDVPAISVVLPIELERLEPALPRRRQLHQPDLTQVRQIAPHPLAPHTQPRLEPPRQQRPRRLTRAIALRDHVPVRETATLARLALRDVQHRHRRRQRPRPLADQLRRRRPRPPLSPSDVAPTPPTPGTDRRQLTAATSGADARATNPARSANAAGRLGNCPYALIAPARSPPSAQSVTPTAARASRAAPRWHPRGTHTCRASSPHPAAAAPPRKKFSPFGHLLTGHVLAAHTMFHGVARSYVPQVRGAILRKFVTSEAVATVLRAGHGGAMTTATRRPRPGPGPGGAGPVRRSPSPVGPASGAASHSDSARAADARAVDARAAATGPWGAAHARADADSARRGRRRGVRQAGAGDRGRRSLPSRCWPTARRHRSLPRSGRR